eukprot:963270_1
MLPTCTLKRSSRERQRVRSAIANRSSTQLEKEVIIAHEKFTFLNKGVTYDQLSLLNMFEVFSSYRGTFFQQLFSDKWLVLEQLMYLVIAVSSNLVNRYTSLNLFGIMDKSGSSIIESLTTFALSLYLSICVGRWWRLRTQGVGVLWDCNNQLALRLSWIYTRYKQKHPENYDEQWEMLQQIQNIRRHCQASISLVFCRYSQPSFQWIDLICRGIVTADEQKQIKSTIAPEVAWSWINNDISRLVDTGCFEDGDRNQYFIMNELMQLVHKGVGAAALITAQLGCNLPFTYFHLVSFIVKVSNIISCLSAGTNDGLDTVDGVLDIFFIMLVTVLFNTMLITGQHIQNPFQNNLGSFPGLKYERGFASDFNLLFQYNVRAESVFINQSINQRAEST